MAEPQTGQLFVAAPFRGGREEQDLSSEVQSSGSKGVTENLEPTTENQSKRDKSNVDAEESKI
jgi:hypothetical protein